MTLQHLRKAADDQLEDNQEGEETTAGRKNWASSKPLVIQNPVSSFDYFKNKKPLTIVGTLIVILFFADFRDKCILKAI